ncbi:hypothetical protein C8R44DRAFT_750569 [Mycena epipterygia]|nr:hypothetical protein C8R44DRAFT_750569 [Mycena epipterygia]
MTTIKFKVSKVARMYDIGISKASGKEQAERGQWYQGVDATDGSATWSVVKEWTQWMDQRQGQQKDTIRWIEPAFRRLMEMPITSLEMGRIDQIGQAAYYWLVQTHAEIEKHRKQFAFDMPAVVNDPDCDTMANCAVAWNTEWTLTVPRLMHHPDVPIPCIELLNMLDDAVIEGLCDGCQKRTVRWLWGTGHVTKEQTLVDKAIAKLMALQTDEPICAALRDNIQYSDISAS